MTTVAGTEEHEGPWGVDGPATETVVLSPRGLAVGRDGSLYVTDGGSFVRRVDPAGTITTIPGADETDNPCALALGDDGSLYIAEAAAERVRRVDPDGATTTVAGTGRHGFSGDGGPAVDAGLGLPNGVAVAPDGSIYIADTWNDRIRRVDADGTITTVAGRGDTPFADKRLATEVPLEASGVAIAPDGSIHVAAHRCVHRIDGDRVIASVAGTGVQGYSGDGGPAVEAELHEAHAIAFGPDGSLYIADCGEQVVRRVAPDGTITTFAGTGPDDDCEEPDPGVADDADALWAWYGRDGGPATGARLVGPWDVAVDAAGNVYIADSENIRITDDVGVESHRIRRVGTDGLITTFAGVGVSGFSGDGGPATKARLGDPTGVAVGPDGSVYIADQDTNRIRRVDPNGVITTVAGTGKERYSGDGGPATKAALDSPEKIAFDREGNLFIADRYNNRVRRVGRDGVITTLAGSGEAGSSGDGGPATEARLTPIALAVGPDGAVYVADDYGRVRLVSHARS
jgi:sugar lactone lactonase YvrE